MRISSDRHVDECEPYLMVAGSPAGSFKADLSLYLDVLEINSRAVFWLAALPYLDSRGAKVTTARPTVAVFP